MPAEGAMGAELVVDAASAAGASGSAGAAQSAAARPIHRAGFTMIRYQIRIPAPIVSHGALVFGPLPDNRRSAAQESRAKFSGSF